MYTSCPECGTVFRISTSDLRLADGHVRCGHCSATFNAVATLSDSPPPSATPVLPPKAEIPTPPSDREAVPRDGDTLEFNIPEDNWSNFFNDDVLPQARPDPEIDDLPAEPIDSPAFDADATDDAADAPTYAHEAPPTPDTDDDADSGSDDQAALHRELAADSSGLDVDDNDWQALLDEVPDDDATDSVYIIEADAPQDRQEAPDPADTPWDEPALDEPATPTRLPPDFAPDLSDDETAADLPDEPAEDPPFAWTPPVPAATDRPQRRWAYAFGSLLLAVALLSQMLHQRRDELATNPAFTAGLQRIYGALQIPLWPAWNLGAYEVRNYEAVADRSSRGALDILARIAVVGDESVGLPLVRVTLSDRFGQSLGSRVFAPDEYLGENPPQREPVSPGTLIPVEISLKDPGADAQGFDVDICLMSQRDGLTCQSEREPFAR